MTATKDIMPAKRCFEHIGGKLGELLLETFIEKKWIAKESDASKHFYITEKGQKEFAKMGLDLSQIKNEKL